MENCNTYIPEYGSETPCELTSASCTIFEDAIAYLGLPENSTLTEVVVALTLSLQDARNRIAVLENA